MSISRTIYSDLKTDTTEFDLGNFVEQILLFDTVLLADHSVLPELIRAVGPDGMLNLLKVGLVGVVGGGPTAQATCDFKRPGFFKRRQLDRPLRFGVETIFVDESMPENLSTEERLDKSLEKTKTIISIKNRHLTKIRNASVSSMRIIDGRSLKPNDDFRDDLSTKHDFVVDVLADHLARESKIPIHAVNWKIRVEEVNDGVFQVNTNLGNLLGINDDKLHELFKRPFFELTGTNLQLQRMRAVHAASGLTEVQANITAKRLDFLSRLHTESDTRATFTKIREVANVPTLEPGTRLDIDALIELRESDEARAFRDWIQNGQTLEEDDIKELLSGWRNVLGKTLKRKNVERLRWLTSTGAGPAFGDAIGVGASALDRFLVKLLPGKGPIGFIEGNYRRYIRQQTRRKK